MKTMKRSALIIFWLHLGWAKGKNQVEQSPHSLRPQERDVTSMSCTYSVSGFNGLQWYRQDSGRGLKHLFSIFSAGDVKQEGRLRATLLRNGSSLHITALQPEDSATYFCAVATQCSPCTCKLYLKLELGRGGMTEASAAGSEPRPV
uniref:Ig-like domain-containing protein n=1 Tax=Castor canadensis TaxID=51338 RepID=A0A8C0W902_CASCN